MATSKEFINHLENRLTHIPDVKTRAMFGEYALYCNGAVVGLVCDETIYIKVTEQTEKLMGDAEKGPPYPGAKDQFIVDERLLEDEAFMKKLLVCCSEDVAKTAKPKKKKK